MRSTSTSDHSKVVINAEEFAAILQGQWDLSPHQSWEYHGLCHSTDKFLPGQVILCRSGEFQHGIDPAIISPDLAKAGVIVPRAAALHRTIKAPILRVDSAPLALRHLARHMRAETSASIIAVTGTVGKTSSCKLLYHLLEKQGRVTTNGQRNQRDGILAEMANLGEVDYLVVEAAMQGFGEATSLLKPHVALLTCVSPVHLSSSNNLLQLTDRKARLFADLAPGGTAVINRDIAHFPNAVEMANKSAGRIVTFGEHRDADFHLTDYDIELQVVSARIFGEDVRYELGLRGRHMAVNSLGALAAACSLGVPLRDLLPHCAIVRPPHGRGELLNLRIGNKRITIIDDSYNASPASMKAAFSVLSATLPAQGGRRIAVLADMLELGDNSHDYHTQLLEPLVQSGTDRVFLAGEMMKGLWELIPASIRGYHAAAAWELLRPLVRELQDGDVVLLKGSHGTRVHEFASDLRFLQRLPNAQGLGLLAYIFAKKGVLKLEHRIPEAASRWASWQIKKFLNQQPSSRP